MYSLTLNLPPKLRFTNAEFEQLVAANKDLCLEVTRNGNLTIMPPTGGNSGKRNADLTFQLQAWNRQSGLGVAFDSSTLFILPNGAKRSPDASWVKLERWNALTPEQQDKFPPICLDFVVELRSPTDTFTELQAKMLEYQDNQARLGWLIDPLTQKVEIYRQNQDVQVLQFSKTLSGEDVLPGFVLDLNPIFA